MSLVSCFRDVAVLTRVVEGGTRSQQSLKELRETARNEQRLMAAAWYNLNIQAQRKGACGRWCGASCQLILTWAWPGARGGVRMRQPEAPSARAAPRGWRSSVRTLTAPHPSVRPPVPRLHLPFPPCMYNPTSAIAIAHTRVREGWMMRTMPSEACAC